MSTCWRSQIVGVARLLFESGDYFVQHFRRYADYSRAATNRERRLIERIRYMYETQICVMYENMTTCPVAAGIMVHMVKGHQYSAYTH